MSNRVEIAVVISKSGQIRSCGPHDYDEADHNDAMSAAITWLLEAGEIPVGSYTLTANLPDPVHKVEGDVKQANNHIEET